MTLVICAFVRFPFNTQSPYDRAACSEQFSKAASDTALTYATERPDSPIRHIGAPRFSAHNDAPPFHRDARHQHLRRFVLDKAHLLARTSLRGPCWTMSTHVAISDSSATGDQHQSKRRPVCLTKTCPAGADYTSRYLPAPPNSAPASRVGPCLAHYLADTQWTSADLTASSVVAC